MRCISKIIFLNQFCIIQLHSNDKQMNRFYIVIFKISRIPFVPIITFVSFLVTGDGCADKPLATLWKNYTGTEKPNILMKVTVCASGLKAVTKEHGLTEYWANRITFCDADPDYPKVFCWIYR